MDFHLSREHALLRQLFREFAQREVGPHAQQVDREGRFPMEIVRQMGELGMLGIPFPEEYGGAGAGMLGHSLLMEELGAACTSTAVVVGAHVAIGAMAIYLDGTESQKDQYLRPLAAGRKLAAFALTEPEAGSDASAIQTTAQRDGSHYRLNGRKIYITNGDVAEVIVVFAVTDPALGARGGVTAFIVEPSFPGFSVVRDFDKMGIRGASAAELEFCDCRVPKQNVLGQVGAGFLTAMKTLDRGRLSVGAGCLGGAAAAVEASIQHARNRHQFGGPIAQKQAVQWMIADAATRVEAARWMTYHAAWLCDQGQPFAREAAMCKLYASEVLNDCVDKAVQLHGGLGYVKDHYIERMYRDARIAPIFEGTNEVQRMVIAADIFKEIGLRL